MPISLSNPATNSHSTIHDVFPDGYSFVDYSKMVRICSPSSHHPTAKKYAISDVETIIQQQGGDQVRVTWDTKTQMGTAYFTSPDDAASFVTNSAHIHLKAYKYNHVPHKAGYWTICIPDIPANFHVADLLDFLRLSYGSENCNFLGGSEWIDRHSTGGRRYCYLYLDNRLVMEQLISTEIISIRYNSGAVNIFIERAPDRNDTENVLKLSNFPEHITEILVKKFVCHYTHLSMSEIDYVYIPKDKNTRATLTYGYVKLLTTDAFLCVKQLSQRRPLFGTSPITVSDINAIKQAQERQQHSQAVTTPFRNTDQSYGAPTDSFTPQPANARFPVNAPSLRNQPASPFVPDTPPNAYRRAPPSPSPNTIVVPDTPPPQQDINALVLAVTAALQKQQEHFHQSLRVELDSKFNSFRNELTITEVDALTNDDSLLLSNGDERMQDAPRSPASSQEDGALVAHKKQRTDAK
jgi:RNA recognition motif-containing protein